jgi:hypothetical protein
MNELITGYIAFRILEWAILKMIYKYINNG